MDMFVKNLSAFTEALGVENAPTIVHMSLIPCRMMRHGISLLRT